MLLDETLSTSLDLGSGLVTTATGSMITSTVKASYNTTLTGSTSTITENAGNKTKTASTGGSSSEWKLDGDEFGFEG